jgi:hypothetical protein
MNRCIGINKKGKKCRYKIKEPEKYFCCDEHKPINKEILENGCFMCCDKVKLDELWILKCNHAFHYDCLNNWFLELAKKNEALECPLCRKEFIQNMAKKIKKVDYNKIYEYKSLIEELYM